MTNEELDTLVEEIWPNLPGVKYDQLRIKVAKTITALRAERDDLKVRLDRAVHAGNVACEIADTKDAEVKRLTTRVAELEAALAEAKEGWHVEMPNAEDLIRAAEAAALERATEVVASEQRVPTLQARAINQRIRTLITPAARTALDAALADARKAGKLEGLREAEAELVREFNITDIQFGYTVVTGASGNPAGCREVVRALAARVEGGDA